MDDLFRLIQLRAQLQVVKMEERGFKRRGRSLTAMLKAHYGLKRNATYGHVIDMVRQDIAKLEQTLLHEEHEGSEH